MNSFVRSISRIQSPSSGSSSCDPEYNDITLTLQKYEEVTYLMIHPGTGTHEEENKNWQEIKKKGIEERTDWRLLIH
jgi:hypothetical protein